MYAYKYSMTDRRHYIVIGLSTEPLICCQNRKRTIMKESLSRSKFQLPLLSLPPSPIIAFSTQWQTLTTFLFPLRPRMTRLPLLSTIVDTLNYLGITPLLQPIIRGVMEFVLGNQLRDLPGIREMRSPRVLKTHLPFCLLDPDLLDTAKVSHLISSYQFCFLQGVRN